MLFKIDCPRDCPLYGDGTGFVPDVYVEGAELALLLQNPGSDEERGQQVIGYDHGEPYYRPVTPQPVIGPTGYALDHTYLRPLGLQLEQVSRLNVLRCRDTSIGGIKTNTMPKGERWTGAQRTCMDTHCVLPSSTRLVIAFGEHALRCVSRDDSLEAWRGYLAPASLRNVPVLVTYHPAAAFRTPSLKSVILNDLKRALAYLRGTWPAPWPRTFLVPAEKSVEAFIAVLNTLVVRGIQCAIDTEFRFDPSSIPGHHQLTILGVAFRNPINHSMDCWQVEWLSLTDKQSQLLMQQLALFAHGLRAVFQNAATDLSVLEFNGGPQREEWLLFDDLLLVHHLLAPDEPHTLEWIASLHGRLKKYTFLLGQDNLGKNLGDIYETLVCWEVLYPRLCKYPSLVTLYQQTLRPLVHLHTRATERGISVNKVEVPPILDQLLHDLKGATQLMQACAGWPVNPGSPGEVGQLATLLYKWAKLTPQKDHKTKKLTIEQAAINKLRLKHRNPPDLDQEEREGLTLSSVLDRIEAGAHPLLEARSLYAAALQTTSHYIYPLVNLAAASSVRGKTEALLTMRETLPQQEDLLIRARIHPRMALHTQATGRWSITKPPLGQVPGWMLPMLQAEEGRCLFSGDWKALHYRLIACLAGDQVTLQQLATVADIHTDNARMAFPGIEVTPAIREGMKRWIYRLLKGADPAKEPLTINDPVMLGRRSELKQAATRWCLAHPATMRWIQQYRDKCVRDGWVEAFDGRRRWFYSKSPHDQRAAVDFPSQAGEVAILNRTLLTIAASFPQEKVHFLFHRHDSIILSVRTDCITDGTLEQIADIIEQPFHCGQDTVQLPASFYLQPHNQPRKPWIRQHVNT